LKKLFEKYLNFLRNLSYNHSQERREFAKIKLIAHLAYMQGYRKTTPFLHPDNWQDDNEQRLAEVYK